MQRKKRISNEKVENSEVKKSQKKSKKNRSYSNLNKTKKIYKHSSDYQTYIIYHGD